MRLTWYSIRYSLTDTATEQRRIEMENKREYSATEIEIAKNLLAKGYKWIARDENNTLYAYKGRPIKKESGWWHGGSWLLLMGGGTRGVIPLFGDINREDDEPVSIRDIVPKILTDEEREWLRTVVKPFRDRLKSVDVHGGSYYGRYVAFIIAHPEKWREDIGEDVEYKSLPVSKDGFKAMENYKKYAPEELGL